MASTYSPSLRLELIGTGDQAGLWGNTTNTNLGGLIEQAIAGVRTVTMVDSDYSLSSLNGSPDEGRCAVIVMTSGVSLTQTRNVVIPTVSQAGLGKLYVVKNSTTGGRSITVKAASGTGVTIPNGSIAQVYYNGTNVYNMLDSGFASNFNLTNATITSLAAALSVLYGGTGATTPAGARTTLGVPSTNGAGASGTWNVDVTGNANTATTADTAKTATTATTAVTADKLSNAVGTAPAYASRGWVNFKGNVVATAVTLTGTYASPTSTIVTINVNNHGLAVGQPATLNFTSGTAVDGTYTVLSVINANSFTIDYGSAIITSGNVNLVRNNEGTYNIADTTVLTVSLADHGLSVGNTVTLDFTSGTAVDGAFLVASVPDLNTFTVTYTPATTTSGTVNVIREVAGSYATPTTTVLTVDMNNHGLTPTQSVYLIFTSGTATGGFYTVASTPTPNRFTIVHTPAIITSGGVNILRNVNGTYSQVASTTMTVTVINHNLQVGHRVSVTYTSGTFSGTTTQYTVETVPDGNTFTYTRPTGSASGSMTLQRREIRASGNVSSVTYNNSAGDYSINFAQALPDENYSFSLSSNAGQTYLDSGTAPTNITFRMQTTDSAGTGSNPAYASATFFR